MPLELHDPEDLDSEVATCLRLIPRGGWPPGFHGEGFARRRTVGRAVNRFKSPEPLVPLAMSAAGAAGGGYGFARWIGYARLAVVVSREVSHAR